MDAASLGIRTIRHLDLDRGWTNEVMKGDKLFLSLANTRRDHAYVGRHFVAWTMVDGGPVINTLFEIQRVGISEHGLNVTVGIARPNVDGIEHIRITTHPTKVPHLDLYLWLPAFAEVRYIPINPEDPSRRRCSLPMLIKHRHRPDHAQHEGYPYFASKGDFLALWPEHSF